MRADLKVGPNIRWADREGRPIHLLGRAAVGPTDVSYDWNALVMEGRVESIWIKRVHGGPMDSVPRASMRAGRGIVGNADQGGRRQVTLIDRVAWDSVVEDLGGYIDPPIRRANLLVSGVTLAGSRGRVLRVGSCRLRINGETRPCAHMDDAVPGLRTALSPPWRGGAFAEVLDDGEIEVGAPVEWCDEN